MALITWNKEFELGIERVDAQHRQLVEIINRFDEGVRSGKGSRIMNDILNDLIGYSQEHFADEERFLAEAGYSDLPRHQAQHRQLLQKVERFQFDFNEAGRRVTNGMQEFLRYWLTQHILISDMEFKHELAGEGEGAPARVSEPVES